MSPILIPILKTEENTRSANSFTGRGHSDREEVTPPHSIIRGPEPSPDYKWKESEDRHKEDFPTDDNMRGAVRGGAQDEEERDSAWETKSNFLKKNYGVPEGFTFYSSYSLGAHQYPLNILPIPIKGEFFRYYCNRPLVH